MEIELERPKITNVNTNKMDFYKTCKQAKHNNGNNIIIVIIIK